MKKIIGITLFSCIFFVIGCKIFGLDRRPQKDTKNNNIKDCDSLEKIIANYWTCNKETKIYHSTNLKVIEKQQDLYSNCFIDNNSFSDYWIKLLGTPNEQSENDKWYFWVYYADNDCLTFRTKGEFSRCDCYFVNLNKITHRLVAKEGLISVNP